MSGWSPLTNLTIIEETEMNKINLGRVLLGGFVAGLVISVGNFLINRVLLRDAMNAEFARLHVAKPGGDFIVKAVVMTFILGIVIIYLYAAIRPRFGAGVKTAICAGLMAWFFVFLYTRVLLFGMGLGMPVDLIVKGTALGLIVYVIGAVAGAWLYKE
jgi:hypothetical protein